MEQIVQQVWRGMNSVLREKDIYVQLDEATPPVYNDRGEVVSVNPIVGSRFLSIGIRNENPTHLNTMYSLTETLAYATNCENAMVVRERGTLWLQFELPKKYWRNVSFSDLLGSGIGIGRGGKVIRYTFNDAYPNAFIAGATGAGKTELIRTIITYIATNYPPDEVRIGLIDPNADYVGMSIPHLFAHETKQDAARELVKAFKRELDKRIAANDRSSIRLVLIADEATDGMVLGEDNNRNEENYLDLTDFAKQCRKYRMNLILGAQNPSHTDFGRIMKNLPYKMVGRVVDKGVSSRLLGAGTRADTLSGKGDFFLQTRGGSLERFQVALVEDTSFLPDDVLPSPIDESFPPSYPDHRIAAEYYNRGAEIDEKYAQERWGIPKHQHTKYKEFVNGFKKYGGKSV